MEDSTAMTIEFLRARLLSERSISKGVKQRADELAKKVMELEEQLKFATLQRKKAEMATEEVLAILENNGIGDSHSESFGSNSDQERVLCESKDNHSSRKEEENCMTSRLSKSGVEEKSGSGCEGSPTCGRSLSWKRLNNSPNSAQKKKFNEFRRSQCSFMCAGDSSTKSHVGKSCRKIKRKETIDAQENGETTGSGCSSEYKEDGSDISKEKNGERVLLIGQGSLEDKQKENDADLHFNGSQKDNVMEIALETQAQLLGRYEAEENAQREWEKKLNEDDCCTQESCELGNQSDITEERDEVRETAELPDGISSQGQEANSDEKEAIMIKTDTKCFPSTALEVGCFQEQQCKNISIGETHFDSEFSFPTQMVPGSVVEGRDIQEWSDMPFGSPKHQSLQKLFSQEDGGQHGGDSSSEIQNELQVAIWHEKPNELGGVLEALQQAKLSLQNELNRLPLARPAWPSLRMSETLLPSIDTVDFMNIPNGCAGLFRVPTDLRSEATPKANILLSHFGSKTSLTSKYPNVGVARSDPYSSSPYLEMYSRDSFLQPYFDPLMDAELAVSSTRFNYHLPPELMPRVPCNDGMVKTFPSIRPEALSGDHSSIYHNNHNRLSVPRMY